jgi:hypothetical protein
MHELNDLLNALRLQALALCQQRGYVACVVDINVWDGQIFYICQASKPRSGPEGLVNWADFIGTPDALLNQLRTVLNLHPVTAPAHAH